MPSQPIGSRLGSWAAVSSSRSVKAKYRGSRSPAGWQISGDRPIPTPLRGHRRIADLRFVAAHSRLTAANFAAMLRSPKQPSGCSAANATSTLERRRPNSGRSTRRATLRISQISPPESPSRERSAYLLRPGILSVRNRTRTMVGFSPTRFTSAMPEASTRFVSRGNP